MIIDAHVHITLPIQKVLHHRLYIGEYKKEMEKLGGIGIIFLNPFDDKYCCPNAFGATDLHKSVVCKSKLDKYRILCEKCGSVHYEGTDVFRDSNAAILKVANQVGYKALAFLSAQNPVLQKQVDYYENEFPDFIGYKIHPTIMMCAADEMNIESKKTIVFHSGNDSYASPKQIINFAKRYEGNVVIAHMARFDMQALKEIAVLENVWVDTSPFTFLYSLICDKPNQVYNVAEWNVLGMEELFFKLMECVGYKKIIFSSDAPFGNLTKELSFINGLNLSKYESACILKNNAIEAFGL